jgi:hypothetical protein
MLRVQIPAGTGKTAYVKSTLEQLSTKAAGRYHVISTAFSAQTTANQVCHCMWPVRPALRPIASTQRCVMCAPAYAT